jgi:pyruvate/2-oxoglutarate dehydrogenase complex dihydrolipoamide acyltransferase (E2) component
MSLQSKKFRLSSLLVILILATVVLAQKDDDKKPAPQPKQAKQDQIKGVEITAVNSTVQDGVKPGTQINLEKVLKLLSKPKAKSKPKPKAAAGLGKRKKPKPAPGPGKSDSRRKVNNMRDRLNTGS